MKGDIMMDERRIPERGREIIESLSGRHSRDQIIEMKRSERAPDIARRAEHASIEAINRPSGTWIDVFGDEEQSAGLMDMYPEGEIPWWEFPMDGC
jgi:hypothetical protein